MFSKAYISAHLLSNWRFATERSKLSFGLSCLRVHHCLHNDNMVSLCIGGGSRHSHHFVPGPNSCLVSQLLIFETQYNVVHSGQVNWQLVVSRQSGMFLNRLSFPNHDGFYDHSRPLLLIRTQWPSELKEDWVSANRNYVHMNIEDD